MQIVTRWRVFRVGIEGQPDFRFEQALEAVRDRPDDESRNVKLGHQVTRVAELDVAHGLWYGDMWRIRMDALPMIADLKGSSKLLDLADDEGVGEETAFLFHPPSQILVLQSTRSGVSPRGFAHYFETLCGLDLLDILPAYSASALVRLGKLHRITLCRIKVAAPQRFGPLSSAHDSLSDIGQIMERHKAPQIVVEMASGAHGKLDQVKDLFRTAARLVGSSADASDAAVNVHVAGYDGDDVKDEIDVFAEQIREEEKMQSDTKRRLSFEERREVVRTVWSRRRKEILDLYGPPAGGS